jgi:hypothetical protein
LPEGRIVAGAISDIFDALTFALQDSRLEPDLDDLLWSTVNVFHRATDRIERELDSNEQAQARQREQDGSEVKSVELENLIAQGLTLIERRDSFEFMRDQAADHYERQVRKPWRPRSGSMVNHRNLTATMIDSRDFIRNRELAKARVPQRNPHRLHRRRKLPEPPPDLGSARSHPREAPRHGAPARRLRHRRRTDRRQMGREPQGSRGPFKPDCETRRRLPLQAQRHHARSDARGVVHFPGRYSGQPRRQGRKLGIPVWKQGGAGAAQPPDQPLPRT